MRPALWEERFRDPKTNEVRPARGRGAAVWSTQDCGRCVLPSPMVRQKPVRILGRWKNFDLSEMLWRPDYGRGGACFRRDAPRGERINETAVFGVLSFLPVKPVVEIRGNRCGSVPEEQENEKREDKPAHAPYLQMSGVKSRGGRGAELKFPFRLEACLGGSGAILDALLDDRPQGDGQNEGGDFCQPVLKQEALEQVHFFGGVRSGVF